MRAIVNTGPGELTWADVPRPQPGPGQVRVRTAFCGICATDLEMIAGWQRTGFPAIPGHEWSGTVDAVGSGVPDSLVGCPCVAENVLADGGEVGFEHPGGYGQFLVTQADRVHRLPDAMPLDQAALIEPVAVCVRAMRRLRAQPAASTLVLGDGPIGLLLLALLKRAGHGAAALVGGREARLAVARELGVSSVLNYHEVTGDLAAAVARLPGHPFGQVIEASGSPAALALALNVSAREGKVLVVGDYGDSRAGFAWNHLLHRELEVIGTCASAGGWEEAVGLASSGALPLEQLISRRFPACRYQEAVETARHDRAALKVLLDWRQEKP